MKIPLSLLVVAMLLCGCEHLHPVCQNTKEDPKKSVVAESGYDLAFVEFGEQGILSGPDSVAECRRPDQAHAATARHHLRPRLASRGGLERRRQFLRLVSGDSKTQLIRDSGLHPIGVYLGWRGESTTIPVIRQFTFYSRKAAAERLASNFDCYDAIAAVSQAARESRGPGGQYTVLIGHSFGGLVVERSVAHAINAEMHGHAAADRSLPADLILMVNPASDSILTRQMIAALASRHTENSRPFLVSLTSTADAATGTAFPISTSLAATTKVFTDVSVPGTERRESERRFYTATPGHNEFLINP